jgi:subtilase family serine protease
MSFLLAAVPVWAQANLQHLPTHHVPQVVTSGNATLVGVLPAPQSITLNIMLPLRNQTQLDDLLIQLNDPSSRDYRHFLTPAEFNAQFGPTEDDYQAVAQWARSKGFAVGAEVSGRLVVPISGTVANVEAAFNLVIRAYRDAARNRTFYAPDREPTVDLSVPLWHIGGMSNYATPSPLYEIGSGPTRNVGSGPGGSFLGSDRRLAYYSSGGAPSTLLTGAGQTVGLFELDGYEISDVHNYFSNVGQPLNVPINNVLIDNASAGSDGNDTEQTIDIIDAVSMAPGLNQVLVFIGPRYEFSAGVTDVDILDTIAENYSDVKQISISWGWDEDYDIDRLIFSQLQAQGQNVFVASGDTNAWSANGGSYPYPASDPNVAAVGGTILSTGTIAGISGVWNSEVAWGGGNSSCTNGGGSGGGIAYGPLIPSYQQISGVINASNAGSPVYRNGPDVAAQADCVNYSCANGSCGTGLGGTSLAAPTWAGLAALANQEAADYENPTMGFINPTIYPIGVSSNYGTQFHDVTSGNNYTYSAVTGYDLVTGWGGPIGWNLVSTLSGVPQAAAPVVNWAETPGPYTCGNELAGYSNPCWLTISGTASVQSGETLYVNEQQQSSPYSFSYTEYWGSGYCEQTPEGYFCFGFASFPTNDHIYYATQSAYGNSSQVVSY